MMCPNCKKKSSILVNSRYSDEKVCKECAMKENIEALYKQGLLSKDSYEYQISHVHEKAK